MILMYKSYLMLVTAHGATRFQKYKRCRSTYILDDMRETSEIICHQRIQYPICHTCVFCKILIGAGKYRGILNNRVVVVVVVINKRKIQGYFTHFSGPACAPIVAR